MPQRDDREGPQHAVVDEPQEVLEDLHVDGIAQVAERPLGRDPLERGDLLVRHECGGADGVIGGLGRPVVHDLLPLARHPVARDADGDAEAHTDAGLFEDLAHGRLGERLAGIDLALGQRDVAIRGAVDERAPSACPRRGARGRHPPRRRRSRSSRRSGPSAALHVGHGAILHIGERLAVARLAVPHPVALRARATTTRCARPSPGRTGPRSAEGGRAPRPARGPRRGDRGCGASCRRCRCRPAGRRRSRT